MAFQSVHAIAGAVIMSAAIATLVLSLVILFLSDVFFFKYAGIPIGEHDHLIAGRDSPIIDAYDRPLSPWFV
jgi:hypothetical protein